MQLAERASRGSPPILLEYFTPLSRPPPPLPPSALYIYYDCERIFQQALKFFLVKNTENIDQLNNAYVFFYFSIFL